VKSEAKRKAGQLEQLHQDFFAASSPAKKQEIRQSISELEWELIEATLTERKQQDLLDKLQDIRQSGEKPFFLWKLNFSEVFKEKGGFDVVIGNPPYYNVKFKFSYFCVIFVIVVFKIQGGRHGTKIQSDINKRGTGRFGGYFN